MNRLSYLGCLVLSILACSVVVMSLVEPVPTLISFEALVSMLDLVANVMMLRAVMGSLPSPQNQ